MIGSPELDESCVDNCSGVTDLTELSNGLNSNSAGFKVELYLSDLFFFVFLLLLAK